MRNALVEIWQCDDQRRLPALRHRATTSKRDKNFQGFGRFLTGSNGEYYFRTIKPVPYPGRTPHIHFGVKQERPPRASRRSATSRAPGQRADGLFRGVRDPAARKTVLVDFEPIKDSKIGELAASFDIVLGRTVEELDDGTVSGGIGQSDGAATRRVRRPEARVL